MTLMKYKCFTYLATIFEQVVPRIQWRLSATMISHLEFTYETARTLKKQFSQQEK